MRACALNRHKKSNRPLGQLLLGIQMLMFDLHHKEDDAKSGNNDSEQ